MSIRKRKGKKGDTYQVYFPYENELGVTCTYRKGGFKTKKEAEKHETLLKAQILKDGYLKVECKLTLNEVAKEYFELVAKTKLSKNTLKNYEIVYNHHLKPVLGLYKIKNLKYPVIQKYFNTYSNLSIGVQSNIKNVLKNIFKYACKCCYVENNPISLVELTGAKLEKKKKTITFNELETIIETFKIRKCHDKFKNESMIISIYIGYYTGLRICEVLALEKNDFDLINNTISVNKQLDCTGKRTDELVTTSIMKTKSSKAIIPLAEPLKEVLLKWFERNPYNHVICDVNGRYIHCNVLKLAINKVSKLSSIDFHFHMLRHTFISNLANNGVSPQIAKELARHSNINTTMDIYTHINEEAQREAIKQVFNAESVKKVSNSISLTN